MADMRNNRLLNAKLNKYIIPGIMMSLALQLGNIVDTIFVSNLIGVEAMSAVTMSLPVETIVQLTGYCLGIGGSIAVGNMLGRRDKESASKLFTATFMVTFLVGIIFQYVRSLLRLRLQGFLYMVAVLWLIIQETISVSVCLVHR